MSGFVKEAAKTVVTAPLVAAVEHPKGCLSFGLYAIAIGAIVFVVLSVGGGGTGATTSNQAAAPAAPAAAAEQGGGRWLGFARQNPSNPDYLDVFNADGLNGGPGTTRCNNPIGRDTIGGFISNWDRNDGVQDGMVSYFESDAWDGACNTIAQPAAAQPQQQEAAPAAQPAQPAVAPAQSSSGENKIQVTYGWTEANGTVHYSVGWIGRPCTTDSADYNATVQQPGNCEVKSSTTLECTTIPQCR